MKALLVSVAYESETVAAVLPIGLAFADSLELKQAEDHRRTAHLPRYGSSLCSACARGGASG